MYVKRKQIKTFLFLTLSYPRRLLVFKTGRFPGSWSLLPMPSHLSTVASIGYSHIQWRDRVGIQPTSLLSLESSKDLSTCLPCYFFMI